MHATTIEAAALGREHRGPSASADNASTLGVPNSNPLGVDRVRRGGKISARKLPAAHAAWSVAQDCVAPTSGFGQIHFRRALAPW